MHTKFYLACLSLLLTIPGIAQQKLLLRFPAVNKDGSLVSFSYQGDIWTVPATGGKPTRLTIHEAYERNCKSCVVIETFFRRSFKGAKSISQIFWE